MTLRRHGYSRTAGKKLDPKNKRVLRNNRPKNGFFDVFSSICDDSFSAHIYSLGPIFFLQF